MEVYIEYTIIDNFAMDYLLLKSTIWLTKRKLKRHRLIIGTCIGTLIAVIIPIFQINYALSFLIKVVLAGLMSYVTVSHKNFIDYFKFFNIFLLMTFAVGGAVIGTLSLVGIDYSVEGIKENGLLPLGISFLFGYVCYIVSRKSINSIMKKIDSEFTCECIIEKSGKKHTCSAFIDSGNMLFDAITNFPIIVCEEKVANQILGGQKQPIRYLPISTASGLHSMPLFDIDSITVLNKGVSKQENAILGIMKNGCKIGSDAQIIIGATFLV